MEEKGKKLDNSSTREPKKVGGLILETLKKMGYSDRIHRQSAVICWSEIVGSEISRETKALRMDGKTLIVKVQKAAWRQQLLFLKNDLLKKIASSLGERVVEDIRFI